MVYKDTFAASPVTRCQVIFFPLMELLSALVPNDETNLERVKVSPKVDPSLPNVWSRPC